ncbi:transposable element Tcb2 transposase [Trichonephila clavipes]|nr:transposable element Tcb2 transposase [Trichonephila clavipes]
MCRAQSPPVGMMWQFGEGRVKAQMPSSSLNRGSKLRCPLPMALLYGRAEVDIPLRRFRRQYEQLSQFERGRIIGMMEAGWSARRVVRELRRSDCVTSRREDRHIVRNILVQPTASSAAIQAQVAPSLGAPVSSRTIRRRLAEGHSGSWYPLRVLPLTLTHRRLRLEWCHARGNWTVAEWSQVVFSNESTFNLSSDYNRVRVWRPRGQS